MKKKVLIWGMGVFFHQAIHIIKNYELTNDIEIKGITSNTTIYKTMYGYNFLNKSEIAVNTIDVVIVAVSDKNFVDVLKEAVSMGFRDYQVMPYWSLCLPGFEIDKYIKLRRNPPSILAINCWGGNTYHSLGIEFMSPCINLRFSESDYIKFVRDWRHYIEQDLIFVKNNRITTEGKFPVALCDDIYRIRSL